MESSRGQGASRIGLESSSVFELMVGGEIQMLRRGPYYT